MAKTYKISRSAKTGKFVVRGSGSGKCVTTSYCKRKGFRFYVDRSFSTGKFIPKGKQRKEPRPPRRRR